MNQSFKIRIKISTALCAMLLAGSNCSYALAAAENNDSKRAGEARQAGETKPSNESKQTSDSYYYFCDRTSFPPNVKYFDYDSRPWKDEEKAIIARLLDALQKDAPGVMALVSESGKIPLLKSPYIPYKNILGKTTSAYVLAVDGALFIADGAESQKDLKKILLHELIHMADLGRHLAYSKEWASFAQPALQRSRRQLSCQFLLDAKAEDFAETRWPSTESCTSYKESLCEFASRFVLDSKFRKQYKKATSILKPLLHPEKVDLDFARHYMAGRIHFRNEKPNEALPEFEAASKADPNAPSPHVFLAQCWFEKKDIDKSRDELSKAKELFAAANITITESLHWRTLSMLANAMALGDKFQTARELLNRIASSHVQYDASMFARRSACNEKLDDLRQALLDYYQYEYLLSHSFEPAHYFDFIEDRDFLKVFLSKSFPNTDGRRSHVFSICWERLAQAAKAEEKKQFIANALSEVGKASASGFYSKDETRIRKAYLSYLSGEKLGDYEKLTETDKNLWQEFTLLRYLAGKPLPEKGSEDFAKVLRKTQPTDSKDTKWLF